MAIIEASRQAGNPTLPIGQLSAIRNLLRLLDSTLPAGLSMSDGQYQMWFSFALIWALGSTIITDDGKRL